MFGKKKALKEILDAKETIPEDQVRLKPLLGIRPGVYLGILYALILVGVLFVALCYPGLANPGSVVAVQSEPAGAAVRVDDVYMGVTPGEIFIPQGDHQLTMILSGFNPYQTNLRIRGRLFGSAFFPARQQITGTLEAPDPVAAFALEAADYAAWSFTGEPTATYQIPLSLSEGAYRSGPGAADAQTYTAMDAMLKGAARFASTRGALRDLLRAKGIIDNGGLSPSPVTLLRSAEDILDYLSTTPGSSAWLAEVLPPAVVSRITGSAWYTKQITVASVLAAKSPAITPSWGARLSLGSLMFREISGGTLVQGNSFPHHITLEAFYMAETEVSYAAWEAFLEANPAWRVEHTETLTAQGLVNGEYLASPDSALADGNTVSGISWYAARAYCQWLTGLLPAALGSWEVRLPAEAEWEYAAKAAGGSGDSGATITDMLGGCWEWCDDPYAPFNFLPTGTETIRAIGSPERVVRGGCWVNPPGSVNAETRASLPPATCSAFVSFRPVIALKGAVYE
ncbi:MAG: SUMF1/EgtB/PvdO family nonheme iron enzyme [Treponema sp.]|jgi:hypothetical protein|nr:SUMF1/EgtB/PvdO family nonheme iron enzyme [Treponema sp.]